MTTTNKLIIYGDIAMDVVVYITEDPQSGQDSAIKNISFTPGGSAANCAAIAAQLGADVVMVGAVGTDAWGDQLRADLSGFGIDVANVSQVKGQSGVTIALVNPSGERTFYSYRGVNALPLETAAVKTKISPGDIVHVTGYSFQDPGSMGTALTFIRRAKDNRARVSVDPSFYFARDVFHRLNIAPSIDYFFPNRAEAELICQGQEPALAVSKLFSLGIGCVIVKLGGDGCFIYSDYAHLIGPTRPMGRVSNTIGAGDAFSAGFLVATLNGLDAVSSAHAANIVAGESIRYTGGHQFNPNLRKIGQFLSAAPKMPVEELVEELHRLLGQ